MAEGSLSSDIVTSTRDKVLVSGILALMLAAWFLTGWDGLTTRSERAESRASVLAIYERLELGQGQGSVEALVAEYPILRVRSYEETLEAETPLEFGAKNWILMLEFQQGVLVAAKVRTPDSASYHPPDAPPDLVADSAVPQKESEL